MLCQCWNSMALPSFGCDLRPTSDDQAPSIANLFLRDVWDETQLDSCDCRSCWSPTTERRSSTETKGRRFFPQRDEASTARTARTDGQGTSWIES